MSHKLKVKSASLFPCLDYKDNYLPLCRGSLKRRDRCLIKRTKIDQTHLVKNGVVASILNCSRPVPSESSILVSKLARVIL